MHRQKRPPDPDKDNELPSKKQKKKPPRNKSDGNKVIGAAMKKMGIEGSVREKTAPCNLETLWSDYADPKILDRIRSTVVWVSKLKARASLFLNYYLCKNAQTVQVIPRLNETLFTELIAAITSRPSIFEMPYKAFCDATGHGTIEWAEGNNSQVLTYAKQEMVKVVKTSIVNNFYMRRLKFLRWKLANLLLGHLLALSDTERKSLLFRVSTFVMADQDRASVDDIPEGAFNLPQSYIEDLQQLRHGEFEKLRELREWILPRVIQKQVGDELKKKDETSKKTPAEIQTKVHKLSLRALIEEDPLCTIPYFYKQYRDITNMDITIAWRECVELKDFSNWPLWSRLRCPMGAFSPVPYYKIQCHFIRIDKTVLKEWNVPLDEDKWWICNLLSLYGSAKKGRIPDLYRWRHLKDPETAMACIEADELGEGDRPCVPGGSFLTDGVAAHISILTFPTKHLHFDGLPKKGYDGIPTETTRAKKTVISSHQTTTGVVKLESCVLGKDWQDVGAVSVDPGAIQVVTGVRFSMGDMANAREDTIHHLVDSDEDSMSYSEDLYKINSGRFQRDLHEKKRRESNPMYQESLRLLSTTSRKTFDPDVLTAYAQVRAVAESALEKELHDIKRSALRRKSFVRRQLCVAHIAHKILGGADRQERRIARREGYVHLLRQQSKIVFFGRALFSGTRGHVTVPRKCLIRQLATLALVVLTNEFNTSKLCPLDFQVLQDVSDDCYGIEKRIRQCETANHGLFSADRDIIGGINIGQKAVFHLLGRPLTAFYP